MKLVEMNLDPDRKTLRQFGFIALGIFGLLGALILWRQKILWIELGSGAPVAAAVLWALAALSGLFSLVAPAANRLLYVGLAVVSYPVGFVVSWLFMAIIFFGVITPLGLLFRLIGRDPLNRRFDRETRTYYVPHRDAEDVERYFRQY